MQFNKMITAVDSHTAGEPTRIITGGLPRLEGDSVRERRDYLADNFDHIRRMLMNEPRGHKDMFGAAIVEPCLPGADAGVMFMHGQGYLDMCGHGTIGAVTVLLETGLYELEDPMADQVVQFNLEAPCGLVRIKATMERGKVIGVSLKNVPCFYVGRYEVELDGIGQVPVDVSYGGNFFAFVDCNKVQTPLDTANIAKLIRLGLEIRDKVNSENTFIHPESGITQPVNLTGIYDESGVHKNIIVFGDGSVDRSPCGSGTSAKMALLNHQGRLSQGEPYLHRSILDTEFKGVITEETSLGSTKAIVPEITGEAYITGIQQFVSDPRDPFKHGFVL